MVSCPCQIGQYIADFCIFWRFCEIWESERFQGNFGGFEGFGPCLGISHPNHPHLGEISKKTFFRGGTFPIPQKLLQFFSSSSPNRELCALPSFCVVCIQWKIVEQLSQPWLHPFVANKDKWRQSTVSRGPILQSRSICSSLHNSINQTTHCTCVE